MDRAHNNTTFRMLRLFKKGFKCNIISVWKPIYKPLVYPIHYFFCTDVFLYMYPDSSDNAKVSLAVGFLNGWEKLHNIKKKGTGMDSNHTPNNKTNEFTVVPLKEKKKTSTNFMWRLFIIIFIITIIISRYNYCLSHFLFFCCLLFLCFSYYLCNLCN